LTNSYVLIILLWGLLQCTKHATPKICRTMKESEAYKQFFITRKVETSSTFAVLFEA